LANGSELVGLNLRLFCCLCGAGRGGIWSSILRPIDAQLMAEAGFNVVRLAEFAWSKMEPTDGHYDFEWLDRAIAILSSHNIQVVLGTPTASAPPWLMAKASELYLMREDGRRATYGNRREYCPNHPLYHDYTRRIVTHMADHYANNPAVIGWQIDNEFGDRCYCPICITAFQNWLRKRYGSIEHLNQSWGTMFWSHVYNEWSEIPAPLTTGGSPNPGLALDFYRFVSDTYVAYQQMQVDIVRATCPKHFITHNFMGFKYKNLNYFDLAQNLDLVSWDNYPRMQWTMDDGVDHSQMSLAHDTMRGLKHKNFWLMEQQAGPGGWEIVSVAPRPGELRLWAYQGIAHGADGMVFFRWRTARFGTEEYWHGLLDHCARPSRRYDEIKRMGAEIKQVGDKLAGTTVKPQVAMILSYDSRFAFQIQTNNPQFGYPEHFHQFYRALSQRQIPIEIVAPTDDLSGYKLVVAPALQVITEQVAENLTNYVKGGGILVVTPRTGVKDETNAAVNMPLPGLLAELCGVEVEEHDSLAPGMRNELELKLPGLVLAVPVAVGVWCDILHPTSATVVARYCNDYYAGKPAITLNRFGQGQVLYIGTFGDVWFYELIAYQLISWAGLRPLLDAPQGIEVTERWQGSQRLLFILNHTDRRQIIPLNGRYQDILNDRVLEGKISLAAFDVLILMPQ
jgi:beta-galactosidase